MLDVCDRDSLHPVDDVIETLLSLIKIAPRSEILPLPQALAHILREPVNAAFDVPPWDNSAMDGYALNSQDLVNNSASLPIAGRIAAGDSPDQTLPSGCCMRIFTGAPLPQGADTVVAQEEVQLEDDLAIFSQVKVGQHVRKKAESTVAGAPLLDTGTRLRPQELGMLASQGYDEVQVYRPLRIGLLSSGDELTSPGETLNAGQIYDVNRYSLGALFRNWGFEVTDYGIMPDNLLATRDILAKASQVQDILISSGGVSVGEEDHLKQAVEDLGELNLWRVAMQPGKPIAFGTIQQTPWFGLPGNPAAALITALIIARPVLLRAQGMLDVLPQSVTLPADFNWHKAKPRQQYLRARVKTLDNGTTAVEVNAQQGSAILQASCWADGLAVIKPNTTLNKGDLVTFIPMSILTS
ncbi:gephyrin-like molybdotransferase Glp [Pseudomonas sp. F1_0610]|uniref:molybdopterin molybdotransferase MoeA n=1 Tax=Pseudomonas sp. F1_0610 TaxID=3114284 RepID=UPI0039C3BCA7